ncbi:FeoA family protein [Aliikangiella sp. IMCC44632]
MAYCLTEVSAQQKVKVVSIGAARSLFRKKLLAMGVTPGIELNITRIAPMGGPLELTLRGFSLSLRRSEAENIHVELMEASA